MRKIICISLFLINFCGYSQEVSFVVKKDSLPKNISSFNLNNKVYHNDTLYKSQINTSTRILGNISKVKVLYYEITINYGKNNTVVLWRESNIFDREVVKYLKKVKSGQEICFTYIAGEDGEGNAYFSPLCFIII